MNRLPIETRARIISCLVEGMGMRATTRLIGCSINTITKLLVDLGTACAIYQNETLRNLTCKRVQVDEIWAFCGSKAKNTTTEKRAEGCGDIWTWVAIDADTKLVPSWYVGGRDADSANVFIGDLAGRIKNRVQLTSDGHKPYLQAVENAFGSNIDQEALTWERLDSARSAALAEEARTENILRERTSIPDTDLNARRFKEVYITPDEALKWGLVHGVAEFSLPKGNEIVQI